MKYLAAFFVLAFISSSLLYRASQLDKVIHEKDTKCREIATLNRIPLSDYSNFMQSCMDSKLPLY